MKSPFQPILLALLCSQTWSFENGVLKSVAEAQSLTRPHSSLLTIAVDGADAFFRNSPFAAAAVVCSIKASTADFIAQRHDFKKRKESGEELDAVTNAGGSLTTKQATDKVDFRRNLAIMVYGGLYTGVFQELSYNHIYPWLFGNRVDWISILRKVTFDMLIQSPFLTLPVAYLSKALIYRYSFAEAIRRYVDDVKNHKLLHTYYALWAPVMVIAFGVIPDRYRVTFCASVSFFWLMILSSISNKVRTDDGRNAPKWMGLLATLMGNIKTQNSILKRKLLVFGK
jgi:hypothetical protein